MSQQNHDASLTQSSAHWAAMGLKCCIPVPTSPPVLASGDVDVSVLQERL